MELERALKKLSTIEQMGNGEDNLIAEIWKYASDITKEKLHQNLTEIWKN